ncbi:hypothetical protein DFH06DRAFT_1435840 [Mycena polygramma]|nr:hypothetical protein DFH06DRAFT_1435840 [Mycena polygramma]
MPSELLRKSLVTAEALRTRCQTEPDMNAYQPLVTSAVEVCVAAIPAESFFACSARREANRILNFSESMPDRQQGLERFESTLDRIRRHIEKIQEGTTATKTVLDSVKLVRESWHLKRALDGVYDALIKCPEKHAVHSGVSRTECIIEIATFGARAVGVICDIPAPGFAVGKPAVTMIALICETAKTVSTNRTSARALARHAQNVTDSVVNNTDTARRGESLTELCRALQHVQDFLSLLNRRRRVTSWIFAVKDKERFAELTSALDRALQTSETISTTEIVRDNTQQLITLAATVNRVEDDLKRNMMVSLLRAKIPSVNWNSPLAHSSLKAQALPYQTPNIGAAPNKQLLFHFRPIRHGSHFSF